MQSILIESQYLPCIEYCAVVAAANRVNLEYQENYQKQSYRNRCRILTAGGPLELSVPIRKPTSNILMKDVRIDYQQKWIKDHWGAIRSAYGNAPFFEHFGFYFEEVFQRKPQYLVELNEQFISLIFKILKLTPQLEITTNYISDPSPNTLDWRSKIHPKKGLKNNPFYKPCNYNQIFGKKFVDNLSIIDLLFCEGPSASQIIKACRP